MKEIWKPVLRFTGMYEVSNLGNVKSLPRMVRSKWGTLYKVKEKIMRQQRCRKYLRVTLHKNGDGKTYCYFVHRLVAQAFIPNPKRKPQVHHKRAPKTNNSVSNLEWSTFAEDNSFKIENGEMPRGSHNPKAKLNTKKVVGLRRLREQGWSLQKLADRFGISKKQAGNVVNRESWKHI